MARPFPGKLFYPPVWSSHRIRPRNGSPRMENSEMLDTPKSLDDGEKLAESYIEICIANNLKFEECKDIGGRIQIAAVTPSGFEWKIRPQDAMD